MIEFHLEMEGTHGLHFCPMGICMVNWTVLQSANSVILESGLECCCKLMTGVFQIQSFL